MVYPIHDITIKYILEQFIKKYLIRRAIKKDGYYFKVPTKLLTPDIQRLLEKHFVYSCTPGKNSVSYWGHDVNKIVSFFIKYPQLVIGDLRKKDMVQFLIELHEGKECVE